MDLAFGFGSLMPVSGVITFVNHTRRDEELLAMNERDFLAAQDNKIRGKIRAFCVSCCK